MEQFKKGISFIKYVLIVLLLVFIVNLLRGGDISKAQMADVDRAVTKAIDMEGLSAADNRMIKRLYGINGNDYADVMLYVSGSNMEVEEVLLVKLKDTTQAEAVETAVNERLDKQLESFEGYGPEQCKLLEDHVLDIQGNYILFVVHQEAKAADKAFQKSL